MLNRSLTYLLLAVFGLTFTPLRAQNVDKARLDSLILKADRGNMPGFAVRILKNNVPIYEAQCGYANIAQRKPMTPASIVNSASITKQFTAYAIYLLEERGKLKTDDDVRAYLPELPDVGTPITLKQLLAHTSGLRDYPDLLSLMNQSTNHRLQYSELVEFLQTHHELNFAPGERFCYSNTGYMLLARVIEKVSGQSYAAFLQQEIFTPLHMTHTFVNEGVLNEQPDGTTNYTLNKCKTKAKKSRPHRDVIGATGIFSNIDDLVLWNRLFYEHESGINPSTIIARMETAGTRNDGASCHYGGGLILKQYRGKPVIEHSGGWGEYLTQWRRFPLEGITIIVTTNSLLDSPFEICDKLSNALLVYGDSLVPEPIEPGMTMPDISGTYISDDNIVRYVRADTIHPRLSVYNAAKTTVNHYALDRIETLADQSTGLFFLDSVDNLLLLKMSDSGNSIHWSMGTYFQVRRTYLKAAPFDGINPGCAGRYYARELDHTIRIRYKRRRKKLVYIPFAFARYALTPIADNVFQVEGENYLIRFTENGILFGNDWIYNLSFERK